MNTEGFTQRGITKEKVRVKKKFKIWTESAKDTHSEEFCYLRLDPGKDRKKDCEAVALLACDVEGKQIDGGLILVLDSKLGIIVSIDGISDDIPLKTDITDTALIYTEQDASEALRPQFRLNMGDIMTKIAEHAAECPVHGKEPTLN